MDPSFWTRLFGPVYLNPSILLNKKKLLLNQNVLAWIG
jgi:hypothetical protein